MSEPTHIQIQLNRPALDRLLGNDTPLEIELRYQIVREFTKRHLTEVANSQMMRDTAEALSQAIKEEIAKEIGSRKQALYSGKLEWTFNSHFQEKLQEVIQPEIDRRITEAVNTSIKQIIEDNQARYVRFINERVQAAFGSAIDKLVNDEIARRLSVASKLGNQS